MKRYEVILPSTSGSSVSWLLFFRYNIACTENNLQVFDIVLKTYANTIIAIIEIIHRRYEYDKKRARN